MTRRAAGQKGLESYDSSSRASGGGGGGVGWIRVNTSGDPGALEQAVLSPALSSGRCTLSSLVTVKLP